MPTITFLHHPPFCPQLENQEIEVLSGFGSPGELVSLAFSLRAQQPVAEVELVASDLIGRAGRIASSAIDLYVVRVWPQAGIGVYQSAPQQVSELLLKDDRHQLRDGYKRGYAHWRHLLRPTYYYVPPNVRLHGNAVTAFPAAQHKQIWISIKIPADSVPGIYNGWVEARSPNGAFSTQRLAIELEVLPIALLEPSQDLFLWYKGTLDPRLPQQYVPPAIFCAQLQDIFDHGFRSVSLNECSREHLQRALDIARTIGFRRNVVLSPRALQFLDQVDMYGMQPIFYVSDEIDVRGQASIADHIANWRMAKEGRAETMISLTSQSFTRRLLDSADIGHPPDVVSYYLPQNLDFFRAYSAFHELHDRPTYYYWMSHMEKPNVHRVLAGLFLWKSGAGGIAPYCYQHLPSRPFSPFNDFDEWDTREQIGNEQPPLKDHMTTYPARSGSIPTVQWKGLSAGINDLRYVTTLSATLDRILAANDLPAAHLTSAVQSRLQNILSRITLGSIDITSDTNQEPYAELDPSQYECFRQSIAQDIVLLQDFALRCRKHEEGTQR